MKITNVVYVAALVIVTIILCAVSVRCRGLSIDSNCVINLFLIPIIFTNIFATVSICFMFAAILRIKAIIK